VAANASGEFAPNVPAAIAMASSKLLEEAVKAWVTVIGYPYLRSNDVVMQHQLCQKASAFQLPFGGQ